MQKLHTQSSIALEYSGGFFISQSDPLALKNIKQGPALRHWRPQWPVGYGIIVGVRSNWENNFF